MVKHVVFESTGLSNEPSSEISNLTQQISSIEEAQEIIYCYLLEIVKQWHPETVLEEFKHLFIQDNDSVSSNPVRAIYEIVFASNQEEFHYTIKRSCYILVNNWVARRKYKYIQNLVEIFKDPIISKRSLSPLIERLRSWIEIFVNSEDYRQLKLYVQTKLQEEPWWSRRYTSYLLATQYSDLRNPVEQREAAKNRARQLKFRFKYDLAMYMARFESATTNQNLQNPTEVGDEVLRIIKIIVAKRDTASYIHMADIFVTKIKEQNYKKFKQSLKDYLVCYGESQQFFDTVKVELWNKLDSLYENWHERKVTDAMLLKTCHKLIDYLTIENSRRQPSQILVSLMSKDNPLTVVILLLKISLICRDSRTYLESCIADLIKYYEKFPEKCVWMINFIEIFNIVFAIYADNILIQISDSSNLA
ncbi:MAG: hypothetical protein M1486_01775 [Gammaproteobacteria bacterium]|nr:hypothetical protein [Gammaproteobacteria bacterium]